MNTRKITVALLGSAFALGMASTAMATNLIQNGTFETSVPSNSTGGGWTSGNIDGAGGWFIAGGNPDEMFILNSTGDASSDPFIYQHVTGLMVGDTYRLTGDYANHYVGYGSRGPNTFGVSLSSPDSNISSYNTFDFPGDSTWGNFTIDFVAWVDNVNIKFLAEINGDDTDYKIDNISLVLLDDQTGGGGGNEVPEPATMLLFASGLAGLARSRFRRKNTT